MNNTTLHSTTGNRLGADASFLLGLAAVVLFFLVSGFVAFLNTSILQRNAGDISQTYESILALDDLLSVMKDAETGQRGFLITGDEGYLDPYTAAVGRIQKRISEIERLTIKNPNHQAQMQRLKEKVDAKLKELNVTIELQRTQGFEAAKAVVITDRGKTTMDAIRGVVSELQGDERALRARRLTEMDEAFKIAVGSGILTGLLGMALSGTVAYLVRRALLVRRRQEWLLAGQNGLSEAMVGDPPLEQLCERILKFLAEYLDAHAGAFFASDSGRFLRLATYGVPEAKGTLEKFEPGDGLLGQAVKDRRTFLVQDVPEGYLAIGSAFGQCKPKHLLIAPFSPDDTANAVLELGFLHPLDESPIELLEKVSASVGVAVQSANYRAYLHNLLEETQRQSEELQAQGEELRVSNEELEEQSRALKDSQFRLEQQQAELEQTNAQIEEHAQILEGQRDELSRSQTALEHQARELKQASQYKSDFLANMSHELRTPLNSSLILAKLLADNPLGNLTPEQVQFAESIQSAGNDLLNLIGDILDLSKIEAGHMEVRVDTVGMSQLVEDLRRIFQPVAAQKGLKYLTQVLPGCPESFVTDRQRLEQVLKNLLSNAFKFTEQGEVQLTVSPATDGNLAFTVADTGIGIPEHQQRIVFEAFRQADGTTNRKYGGTGLGLSISRELTRILGGRIELASEPERGSTFIVTIPQVYDAALVQGKPLTTGAYLEPVVNASATRAIKSGMGSTSSGAHASPLSAFPRQIQDDRERLDGNHRVILVIEDDELFGHILADLAHELEFQCLVATTGEEGLATALQYLPHAVLLDVGLPDQSGLAVLDRLKQDARTRHIPVHVISANDYAHAAMSLGAVGYLLKPVKREELVDALQRIETRLAQRMRRVLVVEDDPVQLESLQKLLSSHQVEAKGATNAAECLEFLKTEAFDCMVLDLSLPDSSGYSLLEKLSQEDAYSFPPVIVYTGRELSTDEEQRLRRYSRSIIIKGAKSPERLLDEVTLFLHQMVADLPMEQQRMVQMARSRDAAFEGRRILIVEDDVRNIFALTSILEPRGAIVQFARNGREALEFLERTSQDPHHAIDLVLMDVMMPEMDGITATREIRKQSQWKNLPIIILTAKAMKDDQEQCLAAGANDYMAKPLDVEKLLSLVRVWMPR